MEVDLIARPSVSVLEVPRRTGILRGRFMSHDRAVPIRVTGK
jgi:hypothetical protein